MILSTNDLIKLVRSSVNVQLPDSGVIDKAYLVMSDEDIALFIKLGISKAYPDVESLDELPDGSEYAVVLLAKIELYLKLAVLKADKIDMGADGAYLKQSQRFEHYMKLADQATKEYDNWLENGAGSGNNTVTTYNVLLSKRHFSNRNYKYQQTPKVRLYLNEVTENSVSFKWSVSNTSNFGKYRVYLSTSQIINQYSDYDSVDENARLIKETWDFRNCYHQISGLSSNTLYYVAVISVEKNGVFGYVEKSFTTPESINETEL